MKWIAATNQPDSKKIVDDAVQMVIDNLDIVTELDDMDRVVDNTKAFAISEAKASGAEVDSSYLAQALKRLEIEVEKRKLNMMTVVETPIPEFLKASLNEAQGTQAVYEELKRVMTMWWFNKDLPAKEDIKWIMQFIHEPDGLAHLMDFMHENIDPKIKEEHFLKRLEGMSFFANLMLQAAAIPSIQQSVKSATGAVIGHAANVRRLVKEYIQADISFLDQLARDEILDNLHVMETLLAQLDAASAIMATLADRYKFPNPIREHSAGIRLTYKTVTDLLYKIDTGKALDANEYDDLTDALETMMSISKDLGELDLKEGISPKTLSRIDAEELTKTDVQEALELIKSLQGDEKEIPEVGTLVEWVSVSGAGDKERMEGKVTAVRTDKGKTLLTIVDNLGDEAEMDARDVRILPFAWMREEMDIPGLEWGIKRRPGLIEEYPEMGPSREPTFSPVPKMHKRAPGTRVDVAAPKERQSIEDVLRRKQIEEDEAKSVKSIPPSQLGPEAVPALQKTKEFMEEERATQPERLKKQKAEEAKREEERTKNEMAAEMREKTKEVPLLNR